MYRNKPAGKGKGHSPRVNLIRYADDFVVTVVNRETLEEIKILLIDFLAQRGLTLSEEKTLITHISEGFDFLGFNVRKYNGSTSSPTMVRQAHQPWFDKLTNRGKLLIKPSMKSQQKGQKKLHEAVFSNKSAS